ncbi:MAG: hypothetical protein JST42_19340 [Bacteroidetes bacterium]|nr:hypothetical protein [Bacteroidota bacterium]
MQKRIYKIFFYTLLLAVYGVFFSVESFFNFEGHTDAKALFKYSTLLRLSDDHQQVVKTSPLQSPGKHKIRLNKRFHQEDIALCPVITVAAPEERIIPRVLGAYLTVPLPSVQVVHLRLRGPPAIA